MTWIQQESSKGLCPMCRQSMFSYPGAIQMLIMPAEFEWKQNDE